MFKEILILFWRGICLACPVCGEGRVFSGWFKMHENCPVCGFHFEREEGYFTGAIAVNLVVSELLLAAVAIPLALQPWASLVPLLLIGGVLAVLLPLLFYRHSKGLWMSLDHLFHPVEN
ncbi:MAG TPA: DUF983 domain-containing protein [Ktedonobacterales bacterium]|nr:DUF983 domain-containing protein [Ktedonobacterales bacterium]